MLDWLVGNFEVFGVAVQNWMVLLALALVAYAAALAFSRGRSRIL
jgi:hypothetical protein